MWHLAMASVLLQLMAAHASDVDLPACRGKKVAILDVTHFADPSTGFQSCDTKDLSEVVVKASDGIVYHRNASKDIPGGGSPHHLGTHAAPWYLREAIKKSQYYTEDLEEADIVYVDDYCYYIAWVGDVHYRGREITTTPGDHLLAAWQALVEMPRWKRRNGEDFVFYDPHPGFMAGDAARPCQEFKCNRLRNSVNLIVDTPMRYVCGGGWPWNKLFVTPYNPNRLDPNRPAAHLELPSLSYEDRTLLAFHRGLCAHLLRELNNFNAGKLIRRYLAVAYMNQPRDVQVKCSNHEFPKMLGGAPSLAFDRMLQKMQHSKFCIVIPGDAASSRRFSEVMMSGCVPAFVGPPWHSMPFVQDVDYRDGALFFNVKEHEEWMSTEMEAKLDANHRAKHETEARWWVPDADIADRIIDVDNVHEVISFLRAMPAAEVKEMLDFQAGMRGVFSFDEQLTEPPNAVNVLLNGICRRARLQPEPG